MSTTHHIPGLLLGLAAVFSGQQAAASTISFEDLSSPLAVTGSALTSSGYQFTTTKGHGVFDASGFGASNGTHFLVYLSSGIGTESFSAVSGAAFNVSSLDLGGWHNFGPTPLSIQIKGYRANGTSVTNTVSVTYGVFASYALTGFTNVTSVRLGSFAGAYLAVDNINVSPVPEPESLAMLLAGLGVLGWQLRRRQPR